MLKSNETEMFPESCIFASVKLPEISGCLISVKLMASSSLDVSKRPEKSSKVLSENIFPIKFKIF